MQSVGKIVIFFKIRIPESMEMARRFLLHGFRCFDKPDLFDEASSLGIEVTTDFSTKEWERIVRQGYPDTDCMSTIMEAKIVPYSTINTKNAIDKKLCKTYDGVTNLELFIFIADIQIFDEWIPELIKYWLDKQEHSPTKYERLFLYSAAAEILWECERNTQNVVREPFPDHFSQDTLRAFASENK